jgi:hypothetical protein
MTDIYINIAVGLLCTLAGWFLKRAYIFWQTKSQIERGKPSVSGSGLSDLSLSGSVFSQGSLGAKIEKFANKPLLKVKDLSRVLKEFVTNDTMLKSYCRDVKLITGYSGPVVWINSTRVSTFFVFTDKKRVLIYDRKQSRENAKSNISPPQSVNNSVDYDMFGSVAFDGAGFVEKVPNSEFHSSSILRIDAIPGIAIEDILETPELYGNLTPAQKAAYGHALPNSTVVMIGLCIELSADDLDKACIPKAGTVSAVSAYEINGKDLPLDALQTSKATLGIKYLRTMYPQ